jgi:transposase-like protein
MNIVERAKAFRESLCALMKRGEWDWQECPHCGSRATTKNGSYQRKPWGEQGREQRRMQRHLCHACRKTYTEQSPELIPRSWYTRAVHRKVLDMQAHMGTSLRRAIEWMRAEIGQQGRYLFWHPLAEEPPDEEGCHLSERTGERWAGQAEEEAAESVAGQMEGIASSGELATDGLWARLRDGRKRVALMVADSVSGLVYPPVVVANEESAESWEALFTRLEVAGVSLQQINGLVSDGARGLLSYLQQKLPWAHQQRCVWHLWRNLGGRIAQQVKAAIDGLEEEAAKQMAEQVRDSLESALHEILDAVSYEAGEQALAKLRLMAWGEPLACWLEPLLDAALMHLMPCHQGLLRVSPEWLWRDYRLRLSHGRNHGSELRLERALLIWAIYHNFTPAQRRSEQKRTYRHPGQSPLEVAGASPGRLSYLDALGV